MTRTTRSAKTPLARRFVRAPRDQRGSAAGHDDGHRAARVTTGEGVRVAVAVAARRAAAGARAVVAGEQLVAGGRAGAAIILVLERRAHRCAPAGRDRPAL